MLTIAPRALTSSAVRENLTGPTEMPSLGSPAALFRGTDRHNWQYALASSACYLIAGTHLLAM